MNKKTYTGEELDNAVAEAFHFGYEQGYRFSREEGSFTEALREAFEAVLEDDKRELGILEETVSNKERELYDNE